MARLLEAESLNKQRSCQKGKELAGGLQRPLFAHTDPSPEPAVRHSRFPSWVPIYKRPFFKSPIREGEALDGVEYRTKEATSGDECDVESCSDDDTATSQSFFATLREFRKRRACGREEMAKQKVIHLAYEGRLHLSLAPNFELNGGSSNWAVSSVYQRLQAAGDSIPFFPERRDPSCSRPRRAFGPRVIRDALSRCLSKPGEPSTAEPEVPGNSPSDCEPQCSAPCSERCRASGACKLNDNRPLWSERRDPSSPRKRAFGPRTILSSFSRRHPKAGDPSATELEVSDHSSRCECEPRRSICSSVSSEIGADDQWSLVPEQRSLSGSPPKDMYGSWSILGTRPGRGLKSEGQSTPDAGDSDDFPASEHESLHPTSSAEP